MNSSPFEIEAISLKTGGIKSTEHSEYKGSWFNYAGENKEAFMSYVADLKKGYVVELGEVNAAGKNFTFKEIINYVEGVPTRKPESQQATLNDNAGSGHAGNDWDDYVGYEELLSKLKKQTRGNYSIETKLLYHDPKEKNALFHTHIKGDFGSKDNPVPRWCDAHGDCDQNNGGMVKMHYVRMAETRSTVRALRKILNDEE